MPQFFLRETVFMKKKSNFESGFTVKSSARRQARKRYWQGYERHYTDKRHKTKTWDNLKTYQ